MWYLCYINYMKVTSINNYNNKAIKQNYKKQTMFGMNLKFVTKIAPESKTTHLGDLSDWYMLDHWFFSSYQMGTLKGLALDIVKKDKATITVFSPKIVERKGNPNEMDYAYKMTIDYKRQGAENQLIEQGIDGGIPVGITYDEQIMNDPFIHELGPFNRILSWLESIDIKK